MLIHLETLFKYITWNSSATIKSTALLTKRSLLLFWEMLCFLIKTSVQCWTHRSGIQKDWPVYSKRYPSKCLPDVIRLKSLKLLPCWTSWVWRHDAAGVSLRLSCWGHPAELGQTEGAFLPPVMILVCYSHTFLIKWWQTLVGVESALRCTFLPYGKFRLMGHKTFQ